MKVVVSFEQDK